jgi:hypothetical protein
VDRLRIVNLCRLIGQSTHVFDWLSALICISGSEAEQRKLRIDWVGR